MPINARFYVLSALTEPVKITLRPGQSVHWSHGGANEEGFDRMTETWTFDGDWVVNRWRRDARDCDGPSSEWGASRCHVMALRSGYLDRDEGVRYPDWKPLPAEAGQRDVYAEAMGY